MKLVPIFWIYISRDNYQLLAFRKYNMKIRTYRCLGGKVRAKRPWRQLFFWHYGGNEYYMEGQSQWYICEAIFWWIPCEIYGPADVDTAEVKIYEEMRKIVVTSSTTGLPLVKKTVVVQSTHQVLYVVCVCYVWRVFVHVIAKTCLWMWSKPQEISRKAA